MAPGGHEVWDLHDGRGGTAPRQGGKEQHRAETVLGRDRNPPVAWEPREQHGGAHPPTQNRTSPADPGESDPTQHQQSPQRAALRHWMSPRPRYVFNIRAVMHS